jgi:hypothetical protein
MMLTRRGFLTYPFRRIRHDMDQVGPWLREQGVRTAGAASSGGGETASEGASPARPRGIGLREARANIRRSEHEQV